LEPLYVLAVTAGLRKGELLGLKWEDLDLDAATLQIRRSLSEARGGRIFEAPKGGREGNVQERGRSRLRRRPLLGKALRCHGTRRQALGPEEEARL
jgi:integrase